MSEREAGELKRQMRRIEELLHTLENLGDPAARDASRELFQTLLAFHRDGLLRLLDIIRQSADGATIAAECGRENVVSGMLLLHGLHPVALETRVRQALEQVR